MSRLTEEQVLEGLNHDNLEVRSLCLEYFTQCYSRNPQVMDAVIQAFDRFGWDKAFRRTFDLDQLIQTESTIQWLVEALTSGLDSAKPESNIRGALERLLSHMDPRLTKAHAEAIFALPGFDREEGNRISKKLAYAWEICDWDGDKLWHELEALPHDSEESYRLTDFDWDCADAIVAELAHQGDSHVPRIMELLEQNHSDDSSPRLIWLMPYAVRLAGELRLEAVGPRIVELMHVHDEGLSEEGSPALQKIGGDAVIQAIAEQYVEAEDHFRIGAVSVLGAAHTDFCVQATRELLAQMEEDDEQTWLVHPLIEQFSTEANEAARAVLVQNIELGFMALYDMKSLRGELAASCTLTGQEFPELQEWTKAHLQQINRIEARTRILLSPPVLSKPEPRPTRPGPTVRPLEPVQRSAPAGRNDPCPCGSGKKYKKCCLNK